MRMMKMKRRLLSHLRRRKSEKHNSRKFIYSFPFQCFLRSLVLEAVDRAFTILLSRRPVSPDFRMSKVVDFMIRIFSLLYFFTLRRLSLWSLTISIAFSSRCFRPRFKLQCSAIKEECQLVIAYRQSMLGAEHQRHIIYDDLRENSLEVDIVLFKRHRMQQIPLKKQPLL